MRYTLRRVSLIGALLYGLLLGLGIWLIPGIALGWLARWMVIGAREWLGGLQLSLPLPFGEGIAIDLTSALPLAAAQARLSALAAQDLALVIAVALGTAAAGMLLTGLMAFVGALLYNVFAAVLGGLEVTLDSLDAPSRRAAIPVVAQPQPATPTAPPPRVTSRPEAAGSSRTPTAWLVAPGNGGDQRPLRNDVTRIGSAPDNDIVVPGLAPQHAEIRRESGRYLIYDLGSRRTWVNDTQVAAVHMLKDGFRLQMGQAEFVVHILANQPSTEER